MSRRRTVIASGYLVAMALSGCTTVAGPVEPIPGSLTYGDRHAAKLTRSPPGSTFVHEFRTQEGRLVQETYTLDQEKRPQLLRREIISDWPD
ncbi:hypothetical protein [Agrobacterium rosae]